MEDETKDQRINHLDEKKGIYKEKLDIGSDGYESICNKLRETCVDPFFEDRYWRIDKIELIENKRLENGYNGRKAAMEYEDLDNKQSREVYLFSGGTAKICDDICKDGHRTGLKRRPVLGHIGQGVHFVQHYDILTRYLAYLQFKSSVFVVVYKAVLGRAKKVDVFDSKVHDEPPIPDANFNCFVSENQVEPRLPISDAMDRSYVYIYDFDKSSNPVKHPRQTLPYGLVTLERKPCVKLSTPFLAVESGGSDIRWEVQGETRRGFRWSVTKGASTRSLREKVDQVRRRRSQSKENKEKEQSHLPVTEDCPPVLNRIDIEHRTKVKKRQSGDIEPPVLNEEGRLYNMIQEIGSKKDRILQIKLQRGAKSSVSNASDEDSVDIWNIVKCTSESEDTSSLEPLEHVSEQCVHENSVNKLSNAKDKRITNSVSNKIEIKLPKHAEDLTDSGSNAKDSQLKESVAKIQKTNSSKCDDETNDKLSNDKDQQTKETVTDTKESGLSERNLISLCSTDVAGNSFVPVGNHTKTQSYHKHSTIPRALKPFINLTRIDSKTKPSKSVHLKVSHNSYKQVKNRQRTDQTRGTDHKSQNKVDDWKCENNSHGSVISERKHIKETTISKEEACNRVGRDKDNCDPVLEPDVCYQKQVQTCNLFKHGTADYCSGDTHNNVLKGANYSLDCAYSDTKETENNSNYTKVSNDSSNIDRSVNLNRDAKPTLEKETKTPDNPIKNNKTKNTKQYNEIKSNSKRPDKGEDTLKSCKTKNFNMSNATVNTKNQSLDDKYGQTCNEKKSKYSQNIVILKPKANKNSFEHQLSKMDALLLNGKVQSVDSVCQIEKKKENNRILSSVQKQTGQDVNSNTKNLDKKGDNGRLTPVTPDRYQEDQITSRSDTTEKFVRNSRSTISSKKSRTKGRSKSDTDKWKSFDITVDVKRRNSLQDTANKTNHINSAKNVPTDICPVKIPTKDKNSSNDIIKGVVPGHLKEIKSMKETHTVITNKLQCDYLAALQLGPAMTNAKKSTDNVHESVKQTAGVLKDKPLEIENAQKYHGVEVETDKHIDSQNSRIDSNEFYNIMIDHVSEHVQRSTSHGILKSTHIAHERESVHTTLLNTDGRIGNPAVSPSSIRNLAKSVSPPAASLAPSILNITPSVPSACKNTYTKERNHINSEDNSYKDKMKAGSHVKSQAVLTVNNITSNVPSACKNTSSNEKTCINSKDKMKSGSHDKAVTVLTVKNNTPNVSSACNERHLNNSKDTVCKDKMKTGSYDKSQTVLIAKNNACNVSSACKNTSSNERTRSNSKDTACTDKMKSGSHDKTLTILTAKNNAPNIPSSCNERHLNTSKDTVCKDKMNSGSHDKSQTVLTAKNNRSIVFSACKNTFLNERTHSNSKDTACKDKMKNGSHDKAHTVLTSKKDVQLTNNSKSFTNNSYGNQRGEDSGKNRKGVLLNKQNKMQGNLHKSPESSSETNHGSLHSNKMFLDVQSSVSLVKKTQDIEANVSKNHEDDGNIRFKHKSGSGNVNGLLNETTMLKQRSTIIGKPSTKVDAETAKRLQRFLQKSINQVHKTKLLVGDTQGIQGNGDKSDSHLGSNKIDVLSKASTVSIDCETLRDKMDDFVSKKPDIVKNKPQTRIPVCASQKNTNVASDINDKAKQSIIETIHRPTLQRSDSTETVIGGINDLTVTASFRSPLDGFSESQNTSFSDIKLEDLNKSPNDQPLDLTMPKVNYEIITYPLDLTKKTTDSNSKAEENSAVNEKAGIDSGSKNKTTVSDEIDHSNNETESVISCEKFSVKKENISTAPSTKDTQSEITKTLHQLSQVLQEISKLSEETVPTPDDEMLNSKSDTQQNIKELKTDSDESNQNRLNTKNAIEAENPLAKAVKHNITIPEVQCHDPLTLQKTTKTVGSTKDVHKSLPEISHGPTIEKQNLRTQDVQAMRDLYLSTDKSENDVKIFIDDSNNNSSNLLKIRERHNEMQKRNVETQKVVRNTVIDNQSNNMACKIKTDCEGSYSPERDEQAADNKSSLTPRQMHIKSESVPAVLVEENTSYLQTETSNFISSNKDHLAISIVSVKKEPLDVEFDTSVETSSMLDKEKLDTAKDTIPKNKGRERFLMSSENNTTDMVSNGSDPKTESVISTFLHTELDETSINNSKTNMPSDTDTDKDMSQTPTGKECADVSLNQIKVGISESFKTAGKNLKNDILNGRDCTIKREYPLIFDCQGEADVGLLETFGTPVVMNVTDHVKTREMHLTVSKTESKQDKTTKESTNNSNKEMNKSHVETEITPHIKSKIPIRKQTSVSSMYTRKHVYGSQKGWLNKDGKFISGIKKPKKDKAIHCLTLTKNITIAPPRMETEFKEKEVVENTCIDSEKAKDKEFVALCIDELLKSERKKSNTYSLPNKDEINEDETVSKIQNLQEEHPPNVLISDGLISEHSINRPESKPETKKNENKLCSSLNEEKEFLQSESPEKSTKSQMTSNKPKDLPIMTFEELKQRKQRYKTYYSNRPYTYNKGRRYQFHKTGIKRNQFRSNMHSFRNQKDPQSKERAVVKIARTDNLDDHDILNFQFDSENTNPSFCFYNNEQQGNQKDDENERKRNHPMHQSNTKAENQVQMIRHVETKDKLRSTDKGTEKTHPDENFSDDIYNGFDAFKYRQRSVSDKTQVQMKTVAEKNLKDSSISFSRKRLAQKRMKSVCQALEPNANNLKFVSKRVLTENERKVEREKATREIEEAIRHLRRTYEGTWEDMSGDSKVASFLEKMTEKLAVVQIKRTKIEEERQKWLNRANKGGNNYRKCQPGSTWRPLGEGFVKRYVPYKRFNQHKVNSFQDIKETLKKEVEKVRRELTERFINKLGNECTLGNEKSQSNSCDTKTLHLREDSPLKVQKTSSRSEERKGSEDLRVDADKGQTNKSTYKRPEHNETDQNENYSCSLQRDFKRRENRFSFIRNREIHYKNLNNNWHKSKWWNKNDRGRFHKYHNNQSSRSSRGRSVNRDVPYKQSADNRKQKPGSAEASIKNVPDKNTRETNDETKPNQLISRRSRSSNGSGYKDRTSNNDVAENLDYRESKDTKARSNRSNSHKSHRSNSKESCEAYASYHEVESVPEGTYNTDDQIKCEERESSERISIDKNTSKEYRRLSDNKTALETIRNSYDSDTDHKAKRSNSQSDREPSKRSSPRSDKQSYFTSSLQSDRDRHKRSLSKERKKSAEYQYDYGANYHGRNGYRESGRNYSKDGYNDNRKDSKQTYTGHRKRISSNDRSGTPEKRLKVGYDKYDQRDNTRVDRYRQKNAAYHHDHRGRGHFTHKFSNTYQQSLDRYKDFNRAENIQNRPVYEKGFRQEFKKRF